MKIPVIATVLACKQHESGCFLFFAELGPFDKPNERREVSILREHDMRGFWLCEDERGRHLAIHNSKLKPVPTSS